MKKFGLAVLFCLIMMVVPMVESAEAAVMNDLVVAPTADIVSRQSALAFEVHTGYKYEVEFVYRMDPRLELGGVFSLYEPEYIANRVGPAVKYNFMQEGPNQPAISAGIKNRDLYVVMSMHLLDNLRAHAGIGDGRYNSLFIGFNTVYNPGQVEIGDVDSDQTATPPVNFMFEYVNRRVNCGARINLDQNMYIDLGLLNFEDFKAGFSYAF